MSKNTVGNLLLKHENYKKNGKKYSKKRIKKKNWNMKSKGIGQGNKEKQRKEVVRKHTYFGRQG